MTRQLVALRERACRACAWLRDERNSRAVTWLWALTVVGVALGIYAPRLYTPPDKFDESQYIRMMAPLTWADFGRWCITPYETFPYFRPAGFFSMFVDRMVWGRPQAHYLPGGELDVADLERQALDPVAAFPYRLTNLLIYLAGCVAFGLMMGQMSRSRSLGALAGLVYAASPRNHITVLYYPERFILLVSLCSFLAGFFFFRRFWSAAPLRGDAVLSAVLFAVALASKEHALLVPVMLALWTVLLTPRAQWQRAFAPLLMMAGVVVVYLAIRYQVRGYFFRDDIASAAGLPRFRTLPVDFVFGAPLLVIRVFVSTLNGAWTLLTVNFWSAVFELVCFWGSAYILVRHQWRLLMSWCLWVPVMYVPVTHAYAFDLFPFKLYLPSAGMPALMALAIWQWGWIATNWKRPLQIAFVLSVALVVREWMEW